MKRGFQRKIHFTKEMEDFLRAFNHCLSNKEFSEILGINKSTVAWKRGLMGLKKMELEYWTPVQEKWLRALYPFIGDMEIAQIFDEAYPKKKGWTLKHIEKKRKYLGLKRTKEQLRTIKQRNKAFGCWMVGSKHTWEAREQAPIGAVKIWNNGSHDYPVIKTNNGFERLARYTWKANFGSIPQGMTVVKKDQTKPEGDINNLELIDRGTLAQRNKLACYPYELRNTIITLNKLNRTIYEKQNN